MYQMTETEYKFAELIWEEEPIGSGELVKQCAEKFGWKKSTTYTEIKRLSQKGFRGEGLRRFAAEDDRSIYPEQEAQRSADR